MEDNLNVFSCWIALNAILILYAIGLFIYGKYFRKKEVLVFVCLSLCLII